MIVNGGYQVTHCCGHGEDWSMQVESTAISDINYDEDREKLFVRFNSGEEYVYVGVPVEVCRAFAEAPSKGGFFGEEIRDRYPYNRLAV
jgi:hypothetical protein